MRPALGQTPENVFIGEHQGEVEDAGRGAQKELGEGE